MPEADRKPDQHLSQEKVRQTDLKMLSQLRHDANAEVGGFAWPTLWLGIGTAVTILSATALGLAGIIPLWLAGLINLCGFCSGYTVGHEIIHGNLIGRHKHLSWLNWLFGTAFFSVPFHSLTMHTYIHLRHHSHTNHPHKDPDAWINGRNPLHLLFRLFTHYPHYNYHVIKWSRGMPNRAAFLAQSMAEQIIPMIAAISLVFAGYGAQVFWLWLMPSIFVYPVLAFILDWAPHHDLGIGTPIDNTRLLGAPKGLAGKALTWAYLFQNFHLIHHLYPKVPFYRYTDLYRKGEPALVAAGARIYPGFHHNGNDNQTTPGANPPGSSPGVKSSSPKAA